MARLNSDARKVLCDMVKERASEKRAALVSELNGLDASFDNDYKKRLAAAHKKLEAVIDHAGEEVAKVLATYGLEWGEKGYNNGVHSIEDIIDDGKLRQDLTYYIKPCKDTVTSKRREGLKQDIDNLDAAVAKARQEILLRAALGMKCDEIVGIINGFEF